MKKTCLVCGGKPAKVQVEIVLKRPLSLGGGQDLFKGRACSPCQSSGRLGTFLASIGAQEGLS